MQLSGVYLQCKCNVSDSKDLVSSLYCLDVSKGSRKGLQGIIYPLFELKRPHKFLSDRKRSGLSKKLTAGTPKLRRGGKSQRPRMQSA